MGNQTKTSPWLSIWVRPRETIRKIVAKDPKKSLWLLATIFGFPAMLGLLQVGLMRGGIQLLTLAIISLILAPIYGYVSFYIWSWIVLWTGRWLDGKGSFQKIRAAFAWSSVPYIGVCALRILILLTMGMIYYLSTVVHEGIHTAIIFLSVVSGLLGFVGFCLWIWSVVIYVIALSEVQKFSVLRGVANYLIPIALGMVFCFVLAAFIGVNIYFFKDLIWNHRYG